MRSLILGILLLPLALMIGPSTATASVINFAALQGTGTPVSGFYGDFRDQGPSLSIDGFTFASTGAVYGLSVWEAADVSHPVGGLAATSLFDYTAAQTTTITKTGGGVFDIEGIDLTQWGADMPGGPGTFQVTFVGTKSDASTVTQIFDVARNAGSPILQSFVFTGFSDLTKVTALQGTFSIGTAFQFNNLVVDADDGAVPVPEPATLVLLGSGLVALVSRRRRRR